jgi:uncharacterized membrane-anchored protein YitT (DUF2179 family)
MFVGRRFFLYSVAGVIIFSTVMFLPCPLISINDMILAALTAGIITGLSQRKAIMIICRRHRNPGGHGQRHR